MRTSVPATLPNPFVTAPAMPERIAADTALAIEAELHAYSERRPLFLRPGFASRIDELPYRPRLPDWLRHG
jgi:hypothetical protein